MNFFYLSSDPAVCAKWHIDKHVVKMPTEYKQCLSTAHRVLDGEMYTALSENGRKIKRWHHPDPVMESGLFKASHVNHPTNSWIRECSENYLMMFDLYVECLKEYTYRYGRIHGSSKNMDLLATPPKNCRSYGRSTAVPQAMDKFPKCKVPGDSITAYHNFYNVDKRSFASWKNRPVPPFWRDELPLELV
jgi:hypothetical protein